LYRELFPEVTRRTITNWRNGGSMPEGAIEGLASLLQARGEALLEGARRLREETPRDRRKGNGGRVPHRKRAERLAREAAGRETALARPSLSVGEAVERRPSLREWMEQTLGRPLD
jgi:hypothetical protein